MREARRQGRGTGNSRNGATGKNVLTGSGELEIEVPRDRNGEVDPQLLKKGQRRLPGFDDKVIPFFAYPPEIRKVIYTTNAIESINATLRKVTRKRGAFPNPDSVRKVLHPAIQKASEHLARPIRDWVAALNHFTMVFEERVPNR